LWILPSSLLSRESPASERLSFTSLSWLNARSWILKCRFRADPLRPFSRPVCPTDGRKFAEKKSARKGRIGSRDLAAETHGSHYPEKKSIITICSPLVHWLIYSKNELLYLESCFFSLFLCNP